MEAHAESELGLSSPDDLLRFLDDVESSAMMDNPISELDRLLASGFEPEGMFCWIYFVRKYDSFFFFFLS